MSLSRRHFFGIGSSALGAFAFSGRALSESAYEEGYEARSVLEARARIFAFGVASGDPLSDRIVLWTHVGSTEEKETLLWQVALDTEFQNIVSEGTGEAWRDHDHTFKVDALLPFPGHTYYYRFHAQGVWSPIGRTRTAPKACQNLRLAVVSCSSIWSGYMNAYEKIAQRNDLDLVIHCGDYAYDVPDPDEQRNMPANSLDAKSPASLDEHRRRYRYYRKDPFLRRAHQQHPWALVWDNHDIKTDSPLSESVQAFHEWLPIRSPVPGDYNFIYRSLDYGDLLKIVALDTRHIGRDSSLAGSEHKSILGDEQFHWLQNELGSSKARWNLLVNQVLLARFEAFGKALAKDAWGGFPADRKRVLELLAESSNGNNIVVTGDAHLSYACDLEESGRRSGIEFLPTSVTRGNLDETVGGFIAKLAKNAAAYAVKALNPHIRYFEGTRHGYGLIDLREQGAHFEFWYVPHEEQSGKEELGFAFYSAIHAKSISQLNAGPAPVGLRQSLPAPRENRLFSKGLEYGGQGGNFFDAEELLKPASCLRRVSIRSGGRIDALALDYDDDLSFRYGGQSGAERSLALESGEYLRKVTIGLGRHSSSTRVFFLRMETSLGRTLEAGKRPSQVFTVEAPQGRHIVGFYGRSGKEIDKLGPIFAPDFL